MDDVANICSWIKENSVPVQSYESLQISETFDQFVEQFLGHDNVDRLDRETRRYWRDEGQEDNIEHKLSYYTQNLLPCEFKVAQLLGRLPKPKWELNPTTGLNDVVLVLLVGYSFEPLLQTVCAYRPREILMVLNRKYGKENGDTIGRLFYKAVENLHHQWPALLPTIPVFRGESNDDPDEEQFPTCADRPDEIFRFLLHELVEKPAPDVVIDITGSKKSMVSSAYLFGALTGHTLSYVDFDKYDERSRRPFGYSCKIGEVDNPYNTFRLANWSRVRRNYQSYALGEAVETLAEFVQTAAGNQDKGSSKLFTDDQLEHLKYLHSWISIFAQWDAGDIPKAYENWKKIEKLDNIQSPAVIEMLGQAWEKMISPNHSKKDGIFSQAQSGAKIWTDLLGSNQWNLVLHYTRDELAKIQRAGELKGDWRTVFMRSANLIEYLLKIRLLMLVNKPAYLYVDPNSPSILFEELEMGTLLEIFEFFPPKIKDGKLENTNYPLKTRMSGNVTLIKGKAMREFSLGLPASWNKSSADRLRDLRNKVFHNLVVIQEQDARIALKWAEDSWDNLIETWVPVLISSLTLPKAKDNPGQDFSLPPWKSLLEACNINFLPVEPDL
jgi:hypothetical protein